MRRDKPTPGSCHYFQTITKDATRKRKTGIPSKEEAKTQPSQDQKRQSGETFQKIWTCSYTKNEESTIMREIVLLKFSN